MSSLQRPRLASPNARIAELELGEKVIELPSHFVTLTKTTDVEKVLEAVQHLESIGEDPPLPNTGGFITELQSVHEILANEQDDFQNAEHEQVTLDGRDAKVNLYAFLEDLQRILIIDPNTDRLFYSNYRDEFIELAPEMADSLPTIIDRYVDEDDDDIDSQFDAFQALRRTAQRAPYCEFILDSQAQAGADLLLPPYYPIERASLGDGAQKDMWNEHERQLHGIDEIPENIRLFKISKDITSRRYSQEVAPVIPLKTDILKAESENGENGRQPPQIWRDIMEAYSGLDCDAYFLKATNARMDPNTLDKTDSEGIVNFVKLFRREYTDAPVFFLGMDELAFVLMAHGLDVYSHPIYDAPFQAGGGFSAENRPDPEDINHNRKFLVPRKWSRTKFDQMDSLGCFCPFCEPFANQDPADIGLHQQDDLRKKHWLWLRDEQLHQVKEAIINDQVRPALMDICTDSEWEKNYIKFL